MIKILHAADLHLDSPFGGLRPEQAAARRKAQRQLPGHLVDLCLTHGCDLLLLAGDVFDGENVFPETVEALQAAFSRCPVPIFIAPGNHDPFTADSPWAKVRWPSQVHIFREWSCVDLPGIRVWGSGFSGREAQDLLGAVTPNESLQIAVLHGEVDLGDSPYNPMSREAIAHSGLDYLALGHIHKTGSLSRAGQTFYAWPGVTMGRGFDETGVHGVYLVELERGECRAELLPIPGVRYETWTIPAGEDPLEAVWKAVPPEKRDWICRVTWTGPSEPLDLPALEETLRSAIPHLELRDETIPRKDLWADCEDHSLRGWTMQTLKKQYDAAEDDETRRTLALAARYALAALEGREAP